MEAKLSFHVRRYIRLCNLEARPFPVDDAILDHIITTYKEYQRKPRNLLKTMIHRLAIKLQSEDDTKSSVTKKRRRSSSSDDEMPSNRSNAEIARSNALNSSIRAQYALNNKQKSERMEMPDPEKDNAFVVERPNTRYADFGGIKAILQEVKELIEYPLLHPEVYLHLGVEPPRGILLHGPPGTGKTMLANAIAGESGAAFLRISAPEIVSGMSGESELKLRELFKEAITCAPSIVFIDEIDAITPKRETSQRGMEKRIVAQLLTSIDSLSLENTGGKPVLIIGATNRPDALDSALRRAGRFDREICLGIPDEKARKCILEKLASKMKVEGAFDFGVIARKTPGYVGADLVSLTKEAAVVAINRIFSTVLSTTESTASLTAVQATVSSVRDGFRANVIPFTAAQMEPLNVNMADFIAAISKVQPSSQREGFATVSTITWADIGALASIRDKLKLSILQPIQHPERFAALGLEMPAGVLLFGPPGCGKTLLAKAIANESEANFISIKGPELLDKYVGESERAVRQVFQRARASAPCVIFFDELDALCPRRANGESAYEGGSGVTERVVNQLLTEMDGLDSRKNVFVIAATNRPDIIDPAMLRPGRLDKLLYVPLPVAEDRLSILQTLTKNCRLDDSVCLKSIAHDPRCEGFSGADLSALIREAGLSVLRYALRDNIETNALYISQTHLSGAFENVFPSVSTENQRMYEKMKQNLRRARTSIVAKD